MHVWTYRDDAAFRPGETTAEAMRRALALGVDGVFSDFPATAVRVVGEFGSSGAISPGERPTRSDAP